MENVEAGLKGKRVLVTGASGFIGTLLAERLAKLGAEVHAAVRPSADTTTLSHSVHSTNLHVADLSNAFEAERVVAAARPEIVFNLAALADARRDLVAAEEVLKETYGITEAVFLGSHKAAVSKFIQFGTIEEYGLGNAPFTETQREQPFSAFSLGKVMGTHLVLTLGKLIGIFVTVVRPASTFGPGQKQGTLIPNLIRAGLAGTDFDMNPGDQLRDFIYVEDVIEGVLLSAVTPKADGEIINLGSSAPITVREIAETVNAALGNPIRLNFGAEQYRPFDPNLFYMDSQKARSILAWEPRMPLADAVKKTVDWYRTHSA